MQQLLHFPTILSADGLATGPVQTTALGASGQVQPITCRHRVTQSQHCWMRCCTNTRPYCNFYTGPGHSHLPSSFGYLFTDAAYTGVSQSCPQVGAGQLSSLNVSVTSKTTTNLVLTFLLSANMCISTLGVNVAMINHPLIVAGISYINTSATRINYTSYSSIREW